MRMGCSLLRFGLGPFVRFLVLMTQEDDSLMQLVEQYGPKRWSVIAMHLPGRIGKQCRERLVATSGVSFCRAGVFFGEGRRKEGGGGGYRYFLMGVVFSPRFALFRSVFFCSVSFRFVPFHSVLLLCCYPPLLLYYPLPILWFVPVLGS